LRTAVENRLEGEETVLSSEPDELPNILETHGAELHALLTRLTLRADVAEDLLQELFLKLRRAAGFTRAVDRKAYAIRAAVHLAFDWRRMRRTTEPLLSDPPGVAESPLGRLIDADELDRILDAMQKLSERSRQVLVLHFIEQQDYAQIAAQLRKTEHQVRGLCHKGLTKLRTICRQPAHEPEN
jgi:RNA polymerase sigma factor (sigma-70 family)